MYVFPVTKFSRSITMPEGKWLSLTAREQAVLLDALVSIRNVEGIDHAEVDALTIKLVHAQSHPRITIGVHGGMVQWTRGNPFPIRICDYDGHDLPDVDERGERCQIWLEPAEGRIDPA
jgi:hypothetical protein